MDETKQIQDVLNSNLYFVINTLSRNYEIWILEQFKQLYSSFPSEFVRQSESPHFLIQTENKIIGIEIAEVFQDSHLGKGSKLKQRESLQNKFGESLLQLLKSNLFRKTSFMLDVDFNNSIPFQKKEIPGLN